MASRKRKSKATNNEYSKARKKEYSKLRKKVRDKSYKLQKKYNENFGAKLLPKMPKGIPTETDFERLKSALQNLETMAGRKKSATKRQQEKKKDYAKAYYDYSERIQKESPSSQYDKTVDAMIESFEDGLGYVVVNFWGVLKYTKIKCINQSLTTLDDVLQESYKYYNIKEKLYEKIGELNSLKRKRSLTEEEKREYDDIMDEIDSYDDELQWLYKVKNFEDHYQELNTYRDTIIYDSKAEAVEGSTTAFLRIISEAPLTKNDSLAIEDYYGESYDEELLDYE